MRVQRIELKAIGPFEDAVLEIPEPDEGQHGELVLFEGPNGSGKTTIAQAIACAVEPGRSPFLSEESALSAPFAELGRRAHSSNGQVVTWIEDSSAVLAVQGPVRLPSVPEQGGPARLLVESRDASYRVNGSLSWAAFAYRGHQQTPRISTEGPRDIQDPALRGALSFGKANPAAEHFGQLLVNLDYELAKATLSLVDAKKHAGARGDPVEIVEHKVSSRREALASIQDALSSALHRSVCIEFPFGEHTPRILIDGEPIALDLLGEGTRSTLSWLSDLLVRLYRIPWQNARILPTQQSFWLILDEIDESLHPTFQMRLVPTLRRLFPNANIYMTTHSPFVVASAAEGYVFPIRPEKDGRVRGRIEPKKLTPGQSLEWVIEEVFGADTGFIDPFTRDALRSHKADISKLRRKEAFEADDWRAFFKRRDKLLSLSEEVQAMVAMQEAPVRALVEQQARASKNRYTFSSDGSWPV